MMLKVMHIITGLNNGGAEAVLYRLCTNDIGVQHAVISMMGMGKYGALLESNGIEVHCLDMPQGRVNFAGLKKLYRLLRDKKPSIVQTWMYHADLIGGIVARLAGVKNVFWNIRHTSLDKATSKVSTILIAKICARLSSLIPRKIICCANKAMASHVALGYSIKKVFLIPNGYELDHLTIDLRKGSRVRQELGLSQERIVLGMVGRYDPLKDHFNLLSALAIVKKSILGISFFLVGRDMNDTNLKLMCEIERLSLTAEILLLDQRSDIPDLMNAMDIHILSSKSEAFPNVLAEAMACGTPCVTTDVGDAALIVGETGWVVPPCNPEALAGAILQALSEAKSPSQWAQRRFAARQRIVDNFGIQKMIDGYHAVWNS